MSIPNGQRLTGFDCEICLMQFDDKDHFPIMLTCGHSFCQMCTVKFWEQGGKQRVDCPTCRFVNRTADVKSLSRNYRLLEALDAQKSKLNVGEKASEPGKCAEDPSHESVFFCEHCSAEWCENCFNQVHAFSKVLQTHQKLPIGKKPYQVPKCKLHHQKDIEFICQDAGCTINDKLLCSICLCHDHTGHSFLHFMDVVNGNEKILCEEDNVGDQVCNDAIQKMDTDEPPITANLRANLMGLDERIKKHFETEMDKARRYLREVAEPISLPARQVLGEISEARKAVKGIQEVQKTIKARLKSKSNLHYVDDDLRVSRVARSKLKTDWKKVQPMNLELILPEFKIQLIDKNSPGPSSS